MLCWIQVAIPTRNIVLVVLQRSGVHGIFVSASWAHHALNLYLIGVSLLHDKLNDVCMDQSQSVVILNSSQDWSLWGSRLGVEGQSVILFLTMLLGMIVGSGHVRSCWSTVASS